MAYGEEVTQVTIGNYRDTEAYELSKLRTPLWLLNDFSPAFAIAFQPIVNIANRTVLAYEALTRGCDGVSYPQLIGAMTLEKRRRFQRTTLIAAIRKAVELGLTDSGASLCLNLEPDTTPGAMNAQFVREQAEAAGLPCGNIVLELTENHKLTLEDLRELLTANQKAGFATAMDDFGAGYAGLSTLADCRPQILKLDRALITDIDTCEMRQTIVSAFAKICHLHGMIIVAEGIESKAEFVKLRQLGITNMQGYLFARPIVNMLPVPDWSVIARSRKSRWGIEDVRVWAGLATAYSPSKNRLTA